MSDIVIKVENLGKKYRLRHQAHHGAGLRHVLQDALTAPFRALRTRAHALHKPKNEVGGSEPSTEEFWALKDVSVEIKRGEVIGIIGRNGAGKSILLKILSRITDPTTGRIEIEGRVASLLEVGTGFHAELTGRENIYLNGTILGMTRREIKKKFDEIVAFAEVEKFLDTPVKHYSSGMYVRLAFAVAAHLEPEILIVDEVLAVGDAQFQQKCLGKMQDVSQREGRTILFVSHNLSALRTLCRTGILLDRGQLREVSPIGKAIQGYLGSTLTGNDIRFQADPKKPSITRVSLDQEGLKVGDLILDISYESPFSLSPPVPGVVITSASGIPVFGSNPKFHREGYAEAASQTGVVRMEARKLPLMGGTYHLSVWLGDWHSNYDHKPDALSFDFKLSSIHHQAPKSDDIGYLDFQATWKRA